MGPVNTETDQQFTKTLRLVNVQENFRKAIFKFLTANKFNKFHRKLLSTLKHASLEELGFMSCIGDQ